MNKAGRLLQKRILAALISGGLLLLPSCGYTLPSGEFGGIVACAVSINMFSAVLGAVEIVGPSAMATLWDKKLGLITQHPEGQFYLASKPSPPLRKLMMQDAPPSMYQHSRELWHIPLWQFLQRIYCNLHELLMPLHSAYS